MTSFTHPPKVGRIGSADRATRASTEPQSSVRLGHTASVPCAFSPGPWKVCRASNGKLLGIGDAGALGITDAYGGLWRSGKEMDANANLIAAAPELYAELQQFVNGVETHMIDSPADDILANVTRRAKAALAKARGEHS